MFGIPAAPADDCYVGCKRDFDEFLRMMTSFCTLGSWPYDFYFEFIGVGAFVN